MLVHSCAGKIRAISLSEENYVDMRPSRGGTESRYSRVSALLD